ncbi:MAG: metallophosphoesterase, partial [Clostridia bacterium]|nr:metallophosphoesterase [Clostridia bacterium]
VILILIISIIAITLSGCSKYNEFEWSGVEKGSVDLKLSVGEDGRFNVLQMADIQFIDAIGDNSLQIMDATIASANPDLIVLTGDQISPEYLVGQKWKAKKILNQITSYFDSKKIPWTAEFGNHDGGYGVIKKREMLEIYQKSAYFVGGLEESDNWETYINEDEDTYCNYFIPVYDGEKVVHGLMLLDCTTCIMGKYKGYTKGQIDFYNQMSEKYDGVLVSIYTHEPTEEFQTMYDNREDKDVVSEFLGEIESPENGIVYYPTKNPDTNEDLRESMKYNKNVKGIYAGHDHLSNFAGVLKMSDDYSVLLAYGRMSSYGFSEWKYFMTSSKKRKIYKNYARGGRVVSFTSDGEYCTFELLDSKDGNCTIKEINRLYF